MKPVTKDLLTCLFVCIFFGIFDVSININLLFIPVKVSINIFESITDYFGDNVWRMVFVANMQ